MSLNTPLASDVHYSEPLTNFGQNFLLNAEDFIALRACPNLPVDKQFNKYTIFNQGDFFRDEARVRADATESAGGGFRTSLDTYQAEVIAFHKDISDRQRANADPRINLELNSTRFVGNKMLIRRERDFVSAFMGTGKWGTDLVGGSGLTKWSGSTGDPIKDVRTAKRVVKGNTGYTPNKMIIGAEAWDTLLENDLVLNRIVGGATTAVPAKVMRGLLASLLELDEIHVINAVYNSANKGATDSFGFMLADDALLYYAPNTLGPEEPTAFASFSWTGFTGATPLGFRMKRFRMEEIESDRIEAEMAYDYKIISTELGYYFSDCS